MVMKTEHFRNFARLWEDTHLEFGVPWLRATHIAACVYLENMASPQDRIDSIQVDAIEALRKAVLKKIAASKVAQS